MYLFIYLFIKSVSDLMSKIYFQHDILGARIVFFFFFVFVFLIIHEKKRLLRFLFILVWVFWDGSWVVKRSKFAKGNSGSHLWVIKVFKLTPIVGPCPEGTFKGGSGGRFSGAPIRSWQRSCWELRWSHSFH